MERKKKWKPKEDVSVVATTSNMIYSVTYYWIHTVLYPLTIEIIFLASKVVNVLKCPNYHFNICFNYNK
jgi:hypothetical protein